MPAGLRAQVALFYLTFLPQFIGPGDPVLPRSFALAAIHVALGVAWLSGYAFCLGRLSAVLSAPAVRRRLELLTGVVLVGFGLRLAWDHR